MILSYWRHQYRFTGHNLIKIKISDDKRLLFHAGTKNVNDKIFVDGGRVMNVVGNGKTLEESIKEAYRQIEGIKFNNIYFRKDIGKKGI